MRQKRMILAATGCKLEVLNNRITTGTLITNVFGDTAINATAQVDGVDIDIDGMPAAVTLTRSSTTVTVTFPASQPHLLGAITDYIVVSGTGNASLDGVYQIASVSSATVVTYTSSTSGTIAKTNASAIPLKFIATNQTSAAASASAAVSVVKANAPYNALVLNCTIYSAGTVILDVLQPGHDAS